MLKALSVEAPLEQSYYLVPRWCGYVSGQWPREQRTWFSILLFCFSLFEVGLLGAVGEITYGLMMLDDLLNALEAFCPAVTNAMCIFKMFTLFIYHKEFSSLISRIRTMLMADTNMEKRKIGQNWACTGNVLSFLLFLTGQITDVAFTIRPWLVNMMRSWEGKESIRLLPFNSYVPEACMQSHCFVLAYLLLVVSGAWTVTVFTTVDGFFLCTCSYLAAGFRMLQQDIRQIFTELHDCEEATVEQNQRIRAKLAIIVERHNTLRDLCGKFSYYFRLVPVMHFTLAAVILGLSILDLMLNFQSAAALNYITHSIAATVQYYLYCAGGSYVSESSLEVGDVIYSIEWYKCDVETRKMVLMILQQAQTMKTVDFPIYTVSLAAFNAMLTKTGSYVAMLKTFTN